MAKAFLSHSSSDKFLVERIATQLGRNNCHLDKLTFEAGEETLEEIFNALDDTDVFVLFISDKALDSKWIKKEIRQAKKNLDKNIIDRVFPLIIDKKITHADERIPNWLKKPYNIKLFDNEVIILKKIRQFLRESNFKQHSHLKEINDLFVGRHEIIQDFERKLINIDNSKPTCIIVSSFFEGIGRRTFLKNGLIKTGLIDKWYEPVLIPINSKESIEDFMYKLNFIQHTPDIFTHDFSKEDMSSKIELAKKYIKNFVDNGEIIFLIDDGGIVLPNHEFVDWFKEIINDPYFQNQLSICIISRFKPNGLMVKKLGNVLKFQIHELSFPDTQILFIQYLKIIGKQLLTEDIKYFINYLNGIPGQVIYAANLIDAMGVYEAKKYVNDILEFDELRAVSVIDFLKSNELCIQILIAFSKIEIISFDLVYKIFGETDDVYKAIQQIFDLSLIYPISSTQDYLKLNSSVSEYITRSRLDLGKKYNDRLKFIAKDAISKPIELDEYSDYSEFLFTLQEMIRSGMTIPSKYMIPSFVLKSMIKEYYDKHYKTVIEIAKKLLENEARFDYQILRETRYWLCLAYCRKSDERFFDEIKYFKDDPSENKKDYYFLLGFYFRNTDKMDDAEKYFLEVLKLEEHHSKTKRELVNVYLRKGEYMKALNWAKYNYNRYKTNILHIQAYFTCLIKKHNLNDEDFETLEDLLDSAKRSLDLKATDIHREMQAEYEYYVEGKVSKAIEIFKESLILNSSKHYAFRALLEIYKRQSMIDDIERLIEDYPDLKQIEEE